MLRVKCKTDIEWFLMSIDIVLSTFKNCKSLRITENQFYCSKKRFDYGCLNDRTAMTKKQTCTFSRVNVVLPSRNTSDREHLCENPIGALGAVPTTFRSDVPVLSSTSTDVRDQ